MIARFAKPLPVLCMITNKVLDFIFDMHGHRIMEWNNTVLNPRSLEIYCNAIAAKGAALENCFGFVDGTVHPICRPSQHQRVVYNGHKRVHALQFQSLALPNGLIGNLYGPVGKHNTCRFAPSVIYSIHIKIFSAACMFLQLVTTSFINYVT